jgi:formylglycine-generating enzyme required for sulfatase activity
MRYLIFLLLLYALHTVLHSKVRPINIFRPGKDHALFFAVQDYDQWTDLKNPIRDAQAIAQKLRTDYGFDDTKIVTNPTLETIQATLNQYLTKTYGADDQLFIFFSGHGSFNDLTKEGFFIPKSGLKNDPFQNSYLALTRLESSISNIPCAHILLTIDACYSGTFNKKIAIDKGDPINPTWRRPGVDSSNGEAKQAWIKAKLAKRSHICITSGGKERTSDGIEHSPLTEAFLKGLENPGEDAVLTIDELVAGIKNLQPEPKSFSFGMHESDGSFLFIQPEKTPSFDSDQDGIPNPRDKCPFEAGPMSNNGCPVHRSIPSGMVLIPGGTFQMGDVMGDKEQEDEKIHTVTLNSFYLAVKELTFEEYDRFCVASQRELPPDEGWGRGQRPVIHVNWYDAIEYCNWRSQQEGLEEVYRIDKGNNNHSIQDGSKWSVWLNSNANGYRLPTEAEWEYAARECGRIIRFGNGKDIANPKEINFDPPVTSLKESEYIGATLPTGSFKPNALGLFDMSGNVWEWCWDWYGDYPSSASINPLGSDNGNYRIIRGGAWYHDAIDARTVSRGKIGYPEVRNYVFGFRIAKSH